MSTAISTNDRTCHCIRLTGDIDISRCRELDEIVSDYACSGRANVVVCLDDVDYCGTAGISMIIRLEHIAASRGGALVVTGASPRVHRVFDVTGLGRFLVEA
ncbi:MAG: STAS domain-containing protein [Candidatus Nanopelagicales bacterium]